MSLQAPNAPMKQIFRDAWPQIAAGESERWVGTISGQIRLISGRKPRRNRETRPNRSTESRQNHFDDDAGAIDPEPPQKTHIWRGSPVGDECGEGS